MVRSWLSARTRLNFKGKNERTGDFDLGKLAVNRRQFVDDGYSGATLVTKTSLAPEWARGGLAICSKGFWSVLKTDTLITEKPRDREAQVVSKIIAAPARLSLRRRANLQQS